MRYVLISGPADLPSCVIMTAELTLIGGVGRLPIHYRQGVIDTGAHDLLGPALLVAIRAKHEATALCRSYVMLLKAFRLEVVIMCSKKLNFRALHAVTDVIPFNS